VPQPNLKTKSQNVRLTNVKTESTGPHPFFDVDQAAFKSCNSL